MRENVLNLSTPIPYRCNTHRYYSARSRWSVRVYRQQAQAPSFYVLLSGVDCFEGPLTWQGADFASHPFRTASS